MRIITIYESLDFRNYFIEPCTESFLFIFFLRGLIISGGGSSVNDSNAIPYDPNIFSLGVPILGICYGFHVIIKHYGGEVSKERVREDGQFEITLDTENNALFQSMERNQNVLLTHGDSVTKVSNTATMLFLAL